MRSICLYTYLSYTSNKVVKEQITLTLPLISSLASLFFFFFITISRRLGFLEVKRIYSKPKVSSTQTKV